MKNKILITTITTALLTFTAAPAIFAEDAVKTERFDTIAAAADGRFMEIATRSSLTEMKAAAIAQDVTKREDVKDFAKSIEKDHTDVNKNLKSLADRMKIELPQDVGDHQAFLDGLKAKTDSDFDRTYAAATVLSHKKIIALFEAFWEETKNADLKAFANNTLPGLRTHLKHSQDLEKKLGGPTLPPTP